MRDAGDGVLPSDLSLQGDLADSLAGDTLLSDGSPFPPDVDALEDAAGETLVALPGSWSNPIAITTFPFSYSGDTTHAPADAVDYYAPCAPETNEAGGEYVFRLVVPTAGLLTASVDEKSGDAIDVDVHLLSAPNADSCIARDHISIGRKLQPGVYWLVVDTWVNNEGKPMAGPFTLTVTLTDTALPPGDVQTPDLSTPLDLTPPTEGTWDNPIVVPSLPYTHKGNTSNPAAKQVSAYSPCAPGTNEGGGEFVYRLELAEAGVLTVSVDDVSGDAVDLDVHLLSAPSGDSCLARDNKTLSKKLPAGTYWVVVDTYVTQSGTPLAGPYTLSISWQEEQSVAGCFTSPIVCTENDKPLVNPVPQEPPGVGGCPAGMTPIDSAACIDRWEAMLVLQNEQNQLLPWSPYAFPGGQTVLALSAPNVVPQGYIDQITAKAACERAGKRLCTDNEWLMACRGSQNWTYPYGPTRQPKVCNDSRTCHPVPQYFETGASWIWSKIQTPCINQMPDGLAATGAYTGCVSPVGAYDMMGNLHEWTSNPTGVFRGGFYVDTKKNGEGCLYATTAHNVYHWDYSTGFRCCADR